ncbi:MAG TPA: cupin domain-containing protein [Steroidobacteraceae bacterium]|nr:cupin domain-containing protein [Steroidobacteraceae bacterium]
MHLHADRTERVVIDTRLATWMASPEPDVHRIMLDRDGAEVARATSIVRYAPGARFKEHEHGQGEEILVLDGEFRDEHGVYPAGTYLRNPWGTRHSPFSLQGCLLFVKLRQIPAADRQAVVVEAAFARCVLDVGRTAREVVLHATADERVSLMRWPAGYTDARHDHPNGEEILVLEGDLADEHGRYGAGTWLRQPTGSAHVPFTRGGCLMWVKRGPR